MAQLATAIAALGVEDRCDPAPPVSPSAAKPFKDLLPQVEAYAGEAHRAPEAILAQIYLYSRHQTWFTLTFANDPAAVT
jgi:hypothetical protein